MTHLDRPHHQVTAIADGARGHTQREMKTARDIAGSSRNDSDKVLFAKTMRHPPTQGRSATPWMAAALLAMTWIWEAQAFPDQVRHLADANHATAARNFDSDGTVGHGAFEALPPGRDGNDKSVQVAQVTTSDAGQSPELQRLEQERKWLEENRVDLEAWLQTSLQQERERSARLAQDLAAAWRDVETQAALAAKASEEASQRRQAAEASATELKQSMQKERERADALALDLSMTRSAIYAYEAQARKAGDEAAELRQAVANDAPSLRKSAQDERERADRLAQDLAAARRDIEIQTALATKASEEASRLKQAGKPTALEFQKSLQQEREWSAQMEQNFAAARRDVETQTALAAKATKEAARLKQAGESGAEELQKSLQQQRERSARLEQDLAATRRDVETQTALAARASEEAARTRQEAERESAGLRSSLQQERARAERLESDLALAQRAASNAVTVGSIARDKSVGENAKPVVDRAPAAGVRGAAQPNSEQAAVAAGLVARASALLGQGNIGAARIVLERAVEMGSAQASFSLAETYDPLILAKWGTYGTRGDAIKARDLYAKADAAGIKEAKARYEALRR